MTPMVHLFQESRVAAKQHPDQSHSLQPLQVVQGTWGQFTDARARKKAPERTPPQPYPGVGFQMRPAEPE